MFSFLGRVGVCYLLAVFVIFNAVCYPLAVFVTLWLCLLFFSRVCNPFPVFVILERSSLIDCCISSSTYETK